ncbi:hypothetical protein Tco_1402423 [Tanacetum coccineum]
MDTGSISFKQIEIEVLNMKRASSRYGWVLVMKGGDDGRGRLKNSGTLRGSCGVVEILEEEAEEHLQDAIQENFVSFGDVCLDIILELFCGFFRILNPQIRWNYKFIIKMMLHALLDWREP